MKTHILPVLQKYEQPNKKLFPINDLNESIRTNQPTTTSLNHRKNTPNIICLTIPIRIPPPHLADPDNHPPLVDNHYHLLVNLYEAYLYYPNSSMGTTLIWMNLFTGILYNATWTHFWTTLMLATMANNHTNP